MTCGCPEGELPACGVVRFRSVGFLADGNFSTSRAIDRTGSALTGANYRLRRTNGVGSRGCREAQQSATTAL